MEPNGGAKDEESGREPYVRPALVTIELEADQVLAVGCKSAAGAPAMGGQPGCGIGAGCSTDGS
jgi:hypothetical protein